MLGAYSLEMVFHEFYQRRFFLGRGGGYLCGEFFSLSLDFICPLEIIFRFTFD